MRSPFILVFSFLLKITYAQHPQETFKFFDAGWKQTKEKKASYLLRVHLTEDTC